MQRARVQHLGWAGLGSGRGQGLLWTLTNPVRASLIVDCGQGVAVIVAGEDKAG